MERFSFLRGDCEEMYLLRRNLKNVLFQISAYLLLVLMLDTTLLMMPSPNS